MLILTVAGMASSAAENKRTERSIRDWFSGIFKRFQKKESRPRPYYLHQPYNPYYYQQFSGPSYQSQNFGSGHGSGGFGGHDHGGAHGGGHDHGGGHGGGGDFAHHGGGHENIHSGHGGDGGGHGHGHGHGDHGNGHGGHGGHNGHKAANIPHGFGPLKSSDVINHGNSGFIGSVQDHSGGHGNEVDVAFESSEGKHSHGGGVHKDTHQNVHPGDGSESLVSDLSGSSSYEGPGSSEIDVNAVSQDVGKQSLHIAPSNSITPVDSQYVSHPNVQLPLEQKEGEIYLDAGLHGSPSNQNQLSFAASQTPNLYSLAGSSTNQVVVSGRPGESVFAPQLGPHDPIIEIVFQDGEPAAPHPPPIIDQKFYEPVSDDVEVFFIEYSPEDNLDDLENLDLSSAQPAILQNLPAGLPYELRNHLINSGVLENAQIEIIDLDKALKDQSLDAQTRSALQQAYSRTNRQIDASNFVDPTQQNKQAVDIRVQRVNHDTKTPEGIVELLSGLKTFRKGTFAGVVEVNDKKTNKFLPVTVDGKKLPLPDTLPLENRKVNGVLVLAPDSKRNGREAKATFTEGRQLQPLPAISHSGPINTKRRRLLDIDWADMDTNGWIPIVNTDT